MAEALTNQFGPEIPLRLARTLVEVDPLFPSEAFLQDALCGHETLPLLPRAKHFARALFRHLPADYGRAIEMLLRSLGPKLTKTEGHGMAPFFYLPHTLFVAEYGLEHFEPSMLAQYELTQRFTAEFSIRPFLERHPEKTLARLRLWANDPSAHVRRLVSEGTRPRLPWAPRLQRLRQDPRPAIELLEMLKDDPESYVRRSVANHLNDLGKEHPEWLLRIAREWSINASKPRRDLLRHALRSLLKQKNPAALEILGYAPLQSIEVARAALAPETLHIGESTTLTFEVTNHSPHPQNLRADFRVHFLRADGKTSPKVFRMPLETIAPGERVLCRRKISLAHKTTRRHYPGAHRVEIQLNGEVFQAGCFDLLP